MSRDPHWFEPVADHLGEAYLRYSFTRGTEQEVDTLVDALGLEPGSRVLDVGCGPGRHSLALAGRGVDVVGVDISETFVTLASVTALDRGLDLEFSVADARELEFEAEFDAAISLCQGAFGLCGASTPGAGASTPGAGASTPGAGASTPGARASTPRAGASTADSPLGRSDPDGLVLDGMARAVRPGGRIAVSAFSAYFQVRYLEEQDDFEAGPGVNHERTEVRNPSGETRPVEIWTTCFTPRELRYMAAASGLVVDEIWSVTPGDYRRRQPDCDHPEFLLLAHR